jgi:hypothetical protein
VSNGENWLRIRRALPEQQVEEVRRERKMTDEPRIDETKLNFSTATCRHHRAVFVATLIEDNIRDWVVMERIRMRFIAEVGRRFTDQEISDFLHTKCVGCTHEEWSIDLIHRLAKEELAWLKVSPNGL